MPTPSSYISSWVVILRDSACFKDYANWLVLGTFVLVEGYKIGYIYVVDVLTRGFHGCVILRSLTGVNFNGFTYLKYDRANVRRTCVYRKKAQSGSPSSLGNRTHVSSASIVFYARKAVKMPVGALEITLKWKPTFFRLTSVIRPLFLCQTTALAFSSPQTSKRGYV